MGKVLFITGKLASQALKETLQKLAPDFAFELAVFPCSVAALMKTSWIAKQIGKKRYEGISDIPYGGYEKIFIPGLCQGELKDIEKATGTKVERGPKSLKELAHFFGKRQEANGYGDYRTKIFAEIVDSHLLTIEQILERAEYFHLHGADIIDIGCQVEGVFSHVREVVRELKKRGYLVSIDTFDKKTILAANDEGVDFLLSMNSSNLSIAEQLECKIVVVPDFEKNPDSMQHTVSELERLGKSYILDPVLDPLNFGFTESLLMFYHTRKRFPDAEMLMGIGNITELTDADSVGINTIMMGIVNELQIDYVLALEQISWARGSIHEIDLARKLMYFSSTNAILPKDVDDGLITIKDPPFEMYTEEELRNLQSDIKDKNFRIFVTEEYIYVFNRDIFLKSKDADQLHSYLDVHDPGHSFYLGRELEKASLALKLKKEYVQEQPLRWGYFDKF